MRSKKLNLLFPFLLLIFSIILITACDQRESSREINPDNNPPVVDNDDDPVSTPPDTIPPGDGGGGGTPGAPGGGGGGEPPEPPPPDDPTPPDTGTGEIRGTVESSSGTPLNGVHVRAVNINDTNIQVSSFSGIDTDLTLVDGAFSIQNVPPGTYRVLIERLDNRNIFFESDRYSSFILNEATTLVFPDEYWNGANESDTDDVTEIETVVVTDGMTVDNVNFITNDTP